MQIQFTESIPPMLLKVVCEDRSLVRHLEQFLKVYGDMLIEKKRGILAFSYAESVADEMKIIFDSGQTPSEVKAKALEYAIDMSVACNRFAAMDTCTIMIKSVTHEGLGMLVGELINKFASESFIFNIEPSACASQAIRKQLQKILDAQQQSQKSDDDWL